MQPSAPRTCLPCKAPCDGAWLQLAFLVLRSILGAEKEQRGVTPEASLLRLPALVPWGWGRPQEPRESQAACWEGCPLTPQNPARPVSQVLSSEAGNLTLQPALPGVDFLLLPNSKEADTAERPHSDSVKCWFSPGTFPTFSLGCLG